MKSFFLKVALLFSLLFGVACNLIFAGPGSEIELKKNDALLDLGFDVSRQIMDEKDLESNDLGLDTSDQSQSRSETPVWVGVGYQGHFSSTRDGKTWATTDPITDSLTNLQDVAFGDGAFIAVGGAQNSMIARSWDGINWEIDLFPGTDKHWMDGIAFGNGIWLAGGGNGTLLHSTDGGDSWVERDFYLRTAVRELHFANGIFVAVGDNGFIGTSSDGIEWVQRTQPNSARLHNATFGHNTWIVMGWHDGSACYTSRDNAQTWEDCPFTSAHFSGAFFTNNTLYVSTEEGHVSSSDGVNWVTSMLGIPNSMFEAEGLWVGSTNNATYVGSSPTTLSTTLNERAFTGFALGYVK